MLEHRDPDLQAESPTHSAIHAMLRLRRPRILVVEDDVDVWRLIERAVRAANPEATVHWASDADGARLALETYQFDVVLADFLLPDSCNGWSILDQSQRLQPQARIAMASALPLRAPETRDVPFLRKPFDLQRCREFVARLLGT